MPYKRTKRAEWVVVVHQSAPARAVFALDFVVGAVELGIGPLLQRRRPIARAAVAAPVDGGEDDAEDDLLNDNDFRSAIGAGASPAASPGQAAVAAPVDGGEDEDLDPDTDADAQGAPYAKNGVDDEGDDEVVQGGDDEQGDI